MRSSKAILLSGWRFYVHRETRDRHEACIHIVWNVLKMLHALLKGFSWTVTCCVSMLLQVHFSLIMFVACTANIPSYHWHAQVIFVYILVRDF